ncbi:phage tail protein [Listeria grandensis]|nr:phage tail protein [Listeria grandensis]
MMYTVLIDNVACSDYGLCIPERPNIVTAEQDIDTKIIRGRNGSLTIPYAYNDVDHEIPFNFLDDVRDFKQTYRIAKPYFKRGSKFIMSDDPHVYRKMKKVQFGDADNTIREYGYFDVTFTFDPFEYLTTQTVSINKGSFIQNEGTIYSQPYMKIYGTGNITLYINSQVFIFKGLTDFIELDCDAMVAFRTVNGAMLLADNLMETLEFPVLEEGKNYFDWIGNVTKIEVNPYWRYF